MYNFFNHLKIKAMKTITLLILFFNLSAITLNGQICSFNCVNGGTDPARIGIGSDVNSFFNVHKGYNLNITYFGDHFWLKVGFDRITSYTGDVVGITDLYTDHGANRAYQVSVRKPFAETYKKLVPYIGAEYDYAHINYLYNGSTIPADNISYELPAQDITGNSGFFKLNRSKLLFVSGIRMNAGPVFIDFAISTGCAFSTAGKLIQKESLVNQAKSPVILAKSDPDAANTKWNHQAVLAPNTKSTIIVGQLTLTVGFMF